ncbi:hypothetical protein GC163_20740 [bacterium]|nr:hypothetical protein [bacterium]
MFGVQCDVGTVKFHVSNSSRNTEIFLYVDDNKIGSIPGQSSQNFFVEVVDTSNIRVEIFDGSQNDGKTVSVDPATQQVDISYGSGFGLLITVNPKSNNKEPADDAACCPGNSPSSVFGAFERAGRQVMGK